MERGPAHPPNEARAIKRDAGKGFEGESFNQSHPELREGEVFLRNIDVRHGLTREWNRIGRATKRMGDKAYTRSGELIEGLRPVFVQKSEMEETREEQAA